MADLEGTESHDDIEYLVRFQCPNEVQLDAQYDELAALGDHVESWKIHEKLPLQIGNPSKKGKSGKATPADLRLSPEELADKTTANYLAKILKVEADKLKICRLLDLLLLAFIELRFLEWDKVENQTRLHPTNQITGRLAWARNYGPRLGTRIYNNEERDSDVVFQTDQAKEDYMHYAECFRHVIEVLYRSPYLRSLDLKTALKTEKSREAIFGEFKVCFHDSVEPIHVLFKALTVSFNRFVPSDIYHQVGKSVNECYRGGKLRGFFYNHILNGPAQYYGTDRLTWNLLWDGTNPVLGTRYKALMAAAATPNTANRSRSSSPQQEPSPPPPTPSSGSGKPTGL